jgi:DNA-binding winged helix-turn-helix (wHTH) protein
MAIAERYAFDRFVLERSQKRLLRADGPPLELTPRQFDALLLLVEHAGTLVDKETFLQTVWPGLVVGDNSVSQAIASLRRLLGDDAQSSRFIQTVQRKGFRFIAPVSVTGFADVTTAVANSNAAAPPVLPVAPGATDTAPVQEDERRVPPDRWRRHLLLAATGSLAGAAGVAWHWSRGANPPATDRQSLAVLPFTVKATCSSGPCSGSASPTA